MSSLPTAKITNPDVTRLINSTEIQSVVRPANAKVQKRPWTQRKNPLVNKAVLFRLNPYAKVLRRQELRTCPLPGLALILIISIPSPSGAKGKKGKKVGVRCWRGVPRHPLRSLKWLVVARFVLRPTCLTVCHARKIREECLPMLTWTLDISRM